MASPPPTPGPPTPAACSETWSQVSLFRGAHLDDEIALVNWMVDRGLLAPSRKCWKCKRDTSLMLRRDKLTCFWQCSKCRRQWSVSEGSVFEHSKLPLAKALMLVLCYAQGARVETSRLAAVLEPDDPKLSKPTVCGWFQCLRGKVAASMANAPPIGGPGEVVQIDEAVLGRRKYNRGRRLNRQTWVLGMITEAGEARFEVVPNRKADTLIPVIIKHVKPGSKIHTDQLRSYSRLNRHKYEHATVNHSIEFVSADGVHTQKIESQWRALRRKFTQGGVRQAAIPVYLAEFTWRRNCRVMDKSPFESLLDLLQV